VKETRQALELAKNTIETTCMARFLAMNLHDTVPKPTGIVIDQYT
jgi:hypothetical protein